MTLLKKRAQSIRARVLILILTLAIVGTAAIIATFFFLMKSYRNLCSVSRDLEAASNELKSSSIRQSDSATNQSALISEVAASTLQVSSISNNIADSMSKIALGAIRTVESCDEGHQAVANGRKSMSKVNDQVQLIANHMVELGEKTQQIDKVLEIINELTEQTNLLSLNATIESAGAGEAGKRFAVVADEVRKLAERAMESTKEIKRLVLDIQETANTTVMVTEEGTNVVEESAILFGKITDSIAEIATFASETSASTTDIKETTFEQNSAIGMISDSLGDINDAARTTENIAKDNFKNVEELTCITDEIKKIV